METLPKPSETLVDEGGNTNHWLASAYSRADIRSEWPWLFEEGRKLGKVWLRVRWTTSEELDNEEFVFFQFGDVEMNGVDTSCVYEPVRPGTPGAHQYWTTEFVSAPSEPTDTEEE